MAKSIRNTIDFAAKRRGEKLFGISPPYCHDKQKARKKGCDAVGISKRTLLLSLALAGLAMMLSMLLARIVWPRSSVRSEMVFYVFWGALHGVCLFAVMLVYCLARGRKVPPRALLYGFLAGVDHRFLILLIHVHLPLLSYSLRFLLLFCAAVLCMEGMEEES